MAHSLLHSIREFIEGNRSVKRVAGDIALTSELILLIRMMLADGELRPEEMANFRQICETTFGIPQADVPQVMQYLKDFGYGTSAHDAAEMFRELEPERKRRLLLNMLMVAKSDERLDVSEAELIKRTAEVLELTAEDIAAARKGL
jgi:uncharacterized tellurite resistance protein B-like protein